MTLPGSVAEMAPRGVAAAGIDTEYAELESSHGHDGFLADAEQLARIVRGHLFSGDAERGLNLLNAGQ